MAPPVSPTQLLILGSTHLGRHGQTESDGCLESTVERIVGWRPDALAIEAMPGEVVATLLRRGGDFTELRVGGFPDAVAARRAAEAAHGVRGVWAAQRDGADPSLSVHDRVVAWCHALEPHTALLLAGGQPEAVRGLDADVVEALVTLRNRGTEAWRITGAAAMRLGLDRLYPFDDHSSWALMADEAEADVVELMEEAGQRVGNDPRLQAVRHREEAAQEDGDLWPFLAWLNSDEVQADLQLIESDSWLDVAGQPDLARRQLAAWRMRNLQMAAHLRGVTGFYPGGRVLALVGNSHVRPLQAALRMDQSDLEIIPAAALAE